MKNRSTGRLGRLFNAVIPGVVVHKLPGAVVPSHAVTLEGCCPGSVVYQVRKTTDAGLKPSSMTLCDKRRSGFTLIELLVVVLIIGILAAIALPQYRVAVGKAQMMKMAPIVRAIYDAAKRCEMANGSQDDCINFENLDVQLPGAATYTPEKSGTLNGFRAKFSSYSCMLVQGPEVRCSATGGERYSNALYAILSDGKAYCLASNWGEYDENKGAHKICKSLGGIKYISGWNTSAQESTFAYYKLP